MNIRLSLLLLAGILATSIIALAAEGEGSAVAAPSATDTVVTTLFSDGSTNTWSQADLVAALQLMNRKYHRDVERPDGRRAWHGALVMQTIDTNRLVKIERYADGTEFEFPFEQPKHRPKTLRPASAGVPPGLAAARARRDAERETTVTVTEIITPDEKVAEE